MLKYTEATERLDRAQGLEHRRDGKAHPVHRLSSGGEGLRTNVVLDILRLGSGSNSVRSVTNFGIQVTRDKHCVGPRGGERVDLMASLPAIQEHLAELSACTRCPRMHPPPVCGRPVNSGVLLVGQAPGDKEPKLGRPFAWTAGRTMFGWFETTLGWSEEETRDRIYFAAVCRCFPGKRPGGGDRVPAPDEIANCSMWLEREFALLQPRLVLAVGKLAIGRFLGERPLVDTIGKQFEITYRGFQADCIPLPHPSGASPWHRIEPGKTLLRQALRLIAEHKVVRSANDCAGGRSRRPARPAT